MSLNAPTSLGGRLFGSRSGIIGAVFLIGVSFLGSRLLGLARTSVIAEQYGTSVELDAFWVAMRLPDLVFQLLAGATLASAFIPVYARVLQNRGERSAWRLASIVLNWVLLGTIALSVAVFFAAEWIVPALAPGLGEDSGVQDAITEDAIFLTRVLLLSPILFSISGMLTGILHARRHFLLPAISPMLYNLAIILGALLLPEQLGVEALVIGVVAGSGLHLMIQLPALSTALVRSGGGLGFHFNLGDPEAREVLRLMAPRTLGLAAAQINLIVLTFFGSLVGDSSISALNFAWLLLMFPVGLFGMSLATAVFPSLAERAAAAGPSAVNAMVSQTLRFTLFLAIPASIGMLLLRDSIVATLLEHGAFDAAATDLVSDALLFYAIGVFAHAAIEIVSRGFYVLGDTRTPVALAIASMLLNIILCAALVGPMELKGLALALSISAIAEFVLLTLLLNSRLSRQLLSPAIWWSAARTIVATAIMGQLVWLLIELLVGLDIASDSWITLLLCVSGGAVVYFLLSLIMRQEEAELLILRVESVLSRAFRR
ncbi:MAG: murein biosynthesis integral membrane protein MurJ [Chloroflexota bacterium]|nr:murein biosynthesis integral membrane protein MurJ [Chloroflexota bacterium]